MAWQKEFILVEIKSILVKVVFSFAALFCICLVGINSAHAAESAGDRLDFGFKPIMLATHQQVSARLVKTTLQNGKYALIQTRIAQPLSVDRWRFSDLTFLAVDCAAKPSRIAVIRRFINAHSDNRSPPKWLGLSDGLAAANMVELDVVDIDRLSFESLSMPRFVNEWPQQLQAPGEHRVAADFACRAFKLSGLISENIENAASYVRETGGFDDIQVLKCRATGRVHPEGVNVEIRHSPAGKAVLLGDKWVMTGTLYADHLSMIDGDLEFRLTRSSGALRLVLRSEMQSVGVGECRTVFLNANF